MTKLSINVNKFALLRNSRGHNNPDVVQVAIDAQKFGADGITVHPRPDERHIKYDDVAKLKKIITTEFNIEGNPREQKFVDLVLANKPTQVTLVPDSENQLTSDHGWDTIVNENYLKEIVSVFKNAGIRTSLFVDPEVNMVEGAGKTGVDRIELYTEAYAKNYHSGKEKAIAKYVEASNKAVELNIGINAGHDLDLHNLKYFYENIPNLLEVSIGHALVCDSLYIGFENAVKKYKEQLR